MPITEGIVYCTAVEAIDNVTDFGDCHLCGASNARGDRGKTNMFLRDLAGALRLSDVRRRLTAGAMRRFPSSSDCTLPPPPYKPSAPLPDLIKTIPCSPQLSEDSLFSALLRSSLCSARPL